ncbi:ATP-dependent DNA helicase Q4-like [Passer domesticus]|uniref:ATP-dependent DNA helicase Q4-like n=1 Tax=Passer domesticus TaxID=48849 RepID=UPI0030FE6537
MERQQELKVLLKRWEAEFLRERRRKPSQADIEEAPEETRRLYREYRALKKREKNSGETGNSGAQKTPKEEQVEDSGFWGSHLNRSPKGPGRRQSPKARAGIAQIFGMKLKAKLGTSGKEPPLTPNPRKIPKPPQAQQTPELGAENPPENPEEPPKFPRIPPSLAGKNSRFFSRGRKIPAAATERGPNVGIPGPRLGAEVRGIPKKPAGIPGK